MKCPACSTILEAVTVANVPLDICTKGCAGIWFNRFELQKFDEKHEDLAAPLLTLRAVRHVPIDTKKQRTCPADGSPMMKHFSSVKRKVEVDECPKCAGVWLDQGELEQIREEFATEADRKKAAVDLFQQMWKAPSRK